MPEKLNNNGMRRSEQWFLRIGGGLAVAAVVGFIALYGDYRVYANQTKENKEELENRKEAISEIPVIRRDIHHIKETIDDFKDIHEKQDEKLDKILERLPQ